MRPNPQETVDLVTFTEEILNGKLHFCAVTDIYFLHSDYLFKIGFAINLATHLR